MTKRAILAQPRGFCAGVDRAIEIVRRALERYGAPVYVLHEIVHNRHVLTELSALGAVFVKSLEEVPEGSRTIFSAHGVARSVVEMAEGRDLRVIDATCPLVTKVHLQAQRYRRADREVILVGHRGHPEVDGTAGRIDGPVHVLCSLEEVAALDVVDPERLAYVTQTTLSVDDTREVIEALKARFPSIVGPALEDICYATQNRQNAVAELASHIDVLFVVGSQNSSNSSRLAELGERRGVRSYLVDDPASIEPASVEGASRVGVTAGASAPEALVNLILERLRELGIDAVEQMDGETEDVLFQLPSELATD